MSHSLRMICGDIIFKFLNHFHTEFFMKNNRSHVSKISQRYTNIFFKVAANAQCLKKASKLWTKRVEMHMFLRLLSVRLLLFFSLSLFFFGAMGSNFNVKSDQDCLAEERTTKQWQNQFPILLVCRQSRRSSFATTSTTTTTTTTTMSKVAGL